ncbi:hypothetical protein BC826DRAFT_1029713 [Russula brevipes]|nr:hypothetical protein BC826DRAFT_1029713 [Russula brevipes]
MPPTQSLVSWSAMTVLLLPFSWSISSEGGGRIMSSLTGAWLSVEPDCEGRLRVPIKLNNLPGRRGAEDRYELFTRPRWEGWSRK